MTNKEARLLINELYSRVRNFQSEGLSSIVNPDLFMACEKLPELKQFETNLQKMLNEFNEQLIKFADEKYPINYPIKD